MDNNTYILTSDGELYHYGVPGMKWGVRRTPAQLGHKPSSKKKKVSKAKQIVDKLKSKRQAKKAAEEVRKKDLALRTKKVSEMSDEELRQHLNRVRMEREAYMIDSEIARLNPKKVSAGKKFANEFKERALGPAAMEAGKKLLSGIMNKAVDKALGDAKDPMLALKKEAEKAGYGKVISEAKKAATEAAEKEYNFKKRMERDRENDAEKTGATEYTKTSSNKSKVFEGTVEGGKSNKSSSDKQTKAKTIIDAVSWEPFDSPSTRSNATSGQQYLESRNVSGLLNSPIAGYLPAPKDDD